MSTLAAAGGAVDPAGILIAFSLGLALAAAAGLRVFLPLLVFAVAARFQLYAPGPPLEWLASSTALVVLGVAATVEIVAYYVPGLDNLLDTIAAPLAVIAGTLLVAAPLVDLPPVIRWTAAVVAGGGAAGLTQGLTTLLRAKSTLLTGGVGNSVVASGELGGATVLSLLAVTLPLVAVAVLVVVLVWLLRRLGRLRKRSVA